MKIASRSTAAIAATLFTLTTGAALSVSTNSHAQDTKRLTSVAADPKIEAAPTEPNLSRLDLHAYGARFAKAIAQAEADARKPGWRWEDTDDRHSQLVISKK